MVKDLEEEVVWGLENKPTKEVFRFFDELPDDYDERLVHDDEGIRQRAKEEFSEVRKQEEKLEKIKQRFRKAI